jgi:hypothetical protein
MYDFRRSSRLYTKEDLSGEARLPSFVCIGAPKCATTWLFRCLSEHPEVFLPDFKEINFFTVCRWGDDYESKGIGYYLDLFTAAEPEQIIGDFSPNLLQDPFAPERLQALLPDARLIVMMRNPIERSHSHYHYVRNRTHYHGHSLLEILEDPSRDPAGFLSQGLYGRQLELWLAHFPMDQFLVIRTEEVHDTPEQVFRRTCEFIDVNPNVVPSSLRGLANPARSMRVPALYGLNLRVSRFLATHGLDHVRTLLKRAGVSRLVQRLNEVPVDNPPLSAHEVSALVAFYRKDNTRLSRLLGRDCSGWLEVTHSDQ